MDISFYRFTMHQCKRRKNDCNSRLCVQSGTGYAGIHFARRVLSRVIKRVIAHIMYIYI